MKSAFRYWALNLVALSTMVVAVQAAASEKPILVGFDTELTLATSTSSEAIRRGLLIAMDEINAAGGVLGGRPLALESTDNRTVPARGVQNLRDLAAKPELVAVFTGKYSPVVLESVPVANALGLPLLDPWAAADEIVDNGAQPNFVFRLSLRDTWALETMFRHAQERGYRKIGMLVPNSGWGRSSLKAARLKVASTPGVSIANVVWYNRGDSSLRNEYSALLRAGGQAIFLIADEVEASLLIREMAAMPAAERLPVISHWGITGGHFARLAKQALREVDLTVVQTYSFIGDTSAIAKEVLAKVHRRFGVEDARHLDSPVGFAHAYDLMHILAMAINKAGSTDRRQIRDALERLDTYHGLVRRYQPPFAPDRHEALSPEQVFMARFDRDGAIVRLAPP